jgi:hypothetical protein
MNPGSRSHPRRDEARANYVYLIERADGVIKVGISKNVRRRRSHLAHASPEKLSILKTIRTKQRLAFHIETGVKVLLRPFRVRGEWFKCSKTLALLALRAAEQGELECRACIAAEIERQRLEREEIGNPTTPQERELDRELTAWLAKHGPSSPLTIHLVGMWERWPEYMREADPESDIFLSLL